MPTFLDAAGVEIPTAVEGRSLVPLLEREPAAVGWREYMHGEHAACYDPDHGMQYLTDGREKYIWYTRSGREQFFDLREDPMELRDLARDPDASERVALWRQRLVDELAPRAEDGLSDGRQLLSGRNLPDVRPGLLQ
jgi:arylsulfatase A-like enzyme